MSLSLSLSLSAGAGRDRAKSETGHSSPVPDEQWSLPDDLFDCINRASCEDPIPPEFQDKITLTLSCLAGHLQIHGDIEPSPVVLGEQASMEKTSQRFQKIATTLADLHAEGLNAQ